MAAPEWAIPRIVTGSAHEQAWPAPRPDGEEAEVPLIGRIAAGVPLDIVEMAEETFRLPRRLAGRGTLFMLRIIVTSALIPAGTPERAAQPPHRQPPRAPAWYW